MSDDQLVESATDTLIQRVRKLFQSDGLIAKAAGELENVIEKAKTLGLATVPGTDRVLNRNDNVNRNYVRVDANALSIVALIFSVAALVAIYMQSASHERIASRDQQVIDAKISASASEVRASVQQQIAQAQATAQAGKEHARIALDEVQRSNAQLEAKGLIRPASH